MVRPVWRRFTVPTTVNRLQTPSDHPRFLSHPGRTVGGVTTFVVLLTYRGAYKGMVGPFADDDAAAAWAGLNAPAADGWSWDVEPLVDPEHLAGYAPPVATRPALRIVS